MEKYESENQSFTKNINGAHLKQKESTFSISLNGILSKNNSQSQTSFDSCE